MQAPHIVTCETMNPNRQQPGSSTEWTQYRGLVSDVTVVGYGRAIPDSLVGRSRALVVDSLITVT